MLVCQWGFRETQIIDCTVEIQKENLTVKRVGCLSHITYNTAHYATNKSEEEVNDFQKKWKRQCIKFGENT